MSKLLAKLLILVLLVSVAHAQTEGSEAEPAETPKVEQPEKPEQTEVEVKTEETAPREWTTSFTPVIWLASTSTDIKVGNRSRNVNLTASEALGDLEGGFTGRLEANNGQWGGFADIFFISLGKTSQVGPLGNVPLDIGVDNFLWQLAGTYRVVNKDSFDLDLLAGVRGYSLDLDVTVKPFTGPAGVLQFPGRFASHGISFVDPILGAKAAWKLSDRWGLDLYGDLGGFGAGSDFTYRLGAGVDYSVSKSVTLRGGYTMIDFDYTQGSGFDKVEYDTTMYGPTLGVGFKF